MKLGNVFNKLFGVAYIKNLATSIERRAFIIEQCNSIDLEYKIVPAINGRDLHDSSFTIQHGRFLLTYPSSAGFIGNQITSYEILNKAIEQDLDNFIMLDDDCVFNHAVNISEESLIELEKNLPSDWDVIILGDMGGDVVTNESILYHKCSEHYEAAGSHGIAVSKRVFTEMQELLAGRQWLGDGVIGRLIDIGKNVYKIYPSLCIQDRSLFSDINQLHHTS